MPPSRATPPSCSGCSGRAPPSGCARPTGGRHRRWLRRELSHSAAACPPRPLRSESHAPGTTSLSAAVPRRPHVSCVLFPSCYALLSALPAGVAQLLACASPLALGLTQSAAAASTTTFCAAEPSWPRPRALRAPQRLLLAAWVPGSASWLAQPCLRHCCQRTRGESTWHTHQSVDGFLKISPQIRHNTQRRNRAAARQRNAPLPPLAVRHVVLPQCPAGDGAD